MVLRLLTSLVAANDHCVSSREKTMNNLRPVNLQDPAIKARSSANLTGHRVTIGLLVTLIVVVMIAWFGFLGWGILELLWTLVAWIKIS
jgi:hypothetical protein